MQKSTIACIVFSLILLSAFRQGGSDSSSNLPLETSFVAGKSGGEITRDQLFKADRLYVYKYDSPAHRVIHFALTVGSKRYDQPVFESASCMFTSGIIHNIQKCLPGDRLFFESIKYVNLRGDTLFAKAICLTVK